MGISVTTNINLRLAEFRGEQAWLNNNKQDRKAGLYCTAIVKVFSLLQGKTVRLAELPCFYCRIYLIVPFSNLFDVAVS